MSKKFALTVLIPHQISPEDFAVAKITKVIDESYTLGDIMDFARSRGVTEFSAVQISEVEE